VATNAHRMVGSLNRGTKVGIM